MLETDNIRYLLYKENEVYYVHPNDLVEVIPDHGGLKDANGNYLSWCDWIFKGDVITAIEETGYVVDDTFPDQIWDDPEEIEEWNWSPAAYYSDNANFHLIVGEYVEKIEIIEEEIIKEYYNGFWKKIKFKNKLGKVQQGYVYVSRYADKYPEFYYTLEED